MSKDTIEIEETFPVGEPFIVVKWLRVDRFILFRLDNTVILDFEKIDRVP